MSQFLTDTLPLIAAAPDGIKALRGLILDLAVRGKLVPQDPQDEPASELLKRIYADSSSVGQKGKPGKSKFPAIESADLPFSLPHGWAAVRLGALLSKIGSGSTPLGGRQVYVEDGVKFLRSQNVWNARLRLDDVVRIPHEIHEKMSRTHVCPGDLLFNITGASIGRCAIVPDDFDTGNVNQHVVIIRVLDGRLKAFLHTTLVSSYVQRTVQDVQVGVSREGLSVGKLANFVIPLPPLAEQRRIVAKVDELMVLCDRLEAQQADAEAVHATLIKTLLDTLTQSQNADDLATNWRRLSQHFPAIFTTEASVDALKQAVLTLAISGKLSSRDSGDVPASVLLKSMSSEKERQIAAGNIRRQFALMREPNGIGNAPLPEAWAWISIDDAFHVSGGIQKTPARQPRHNSYPYVGVGNVYRGYLDLRSISQFELIDGELEKFRLENGDILVVEGNGSANEIGRCAVWNNAIPQCVHQNHIIRCRPVDKNIVPYVELYLNSPQGIEVMKALAVTSSGLYNLSVGKIRSIWLPLPPLAEQHRIVAKVDELLALCDTLKAQIAETRQVQRQLAVALIDQTLAA